MTDDKTIEVREEGGIDDIPGSKSIEKKLLNVVMKGGPLARNPDFTIEIDGEPVKNARRAVITADVGDALRLETEHILVFADVSVTVASWERTAVADVRLRSEGDAEMVKVEGRGKTALEALKDAVRQLEPQA